MFYSFKTAAKGVWLRMEAEHGGIKYGGSEPVPDYANSPLVEQPSRGLNAGCHGELAEGRGARTRLQWDIVILRVPG